MVAGGGMGIAGDGDALTDADADGAAGAVGAGAVAAGAWLARSPFVGVGFVTATRRGAAFVRVAGGLVAGFTPGSASSACKSTVTCA